MTTAKTSNWKLDTAAAAIRDHYDETSFLGYMNGRCLANRAHVALEACPACTFTCDELLTAILASGRVDYNEGFGRSNYTAKMGLALAADAKKGLCDREPGRPAQNQKAGGVPIFPTK